MRSIALTSIALACAAAATAAPLPQPINPKAASASTSKTGSPASNAIDGKVGDDSRWVSEPSPSPAWLVVELEEKRELAGVHLFTGMGEQDVVCSPRHLEALTKRVRAPCAQTIHQESPCHAPLPS